MSGRVWTTLADGRRVRGYRKTLRQQRRPTVEHRRPADSPDWVLSFELPGTLALGLNAHPGIIGVRCRPDGHVEARGKNREFLWGQIEAFLRVATPHGLPRPLGVRETRAAEPGPTLSGPLRQAHDRVTEIAFDGKTLILIGNGRVRSERRFGQARRAGI
jgi:hypothetical protein